MLSRLGMIQRKYFQTISCQSANSEDFFYVSKFLDRMSYPPMLVGDRNLIIYRIIGLRMD